MHNFGDWNTPVLSLLTSGTDVSSDSSSNPSAAVEQKGFEKKRLYRLQSSSHRCEQRPTVHSRHCKPSQRERYDTYTMKNINVAFSLSEHKQRISRNMEQTHSQIGKSHVVIASSKHIKRFTALILVILKKRQLSILTCNLMAD